MSTAKGLILFRDYLTNSSNKNKSTPPVSIKADDLDGNFRKVHILDSNKEKPLFTMTEGGTVPSTMLFDVCINGELKKIRFIGAIVN